jgi:hypothetical protein
VCVCERERESLKLLVYRLGASAVRRGLIPQ